MTARVVHAGSPIGHLVSREPIAVGDDAGLADVARVMRAAGVSAVLVNPHSAVATERDLARALAAGLGPDEPVGRIATLHPVRVPAEMTVVDAAALMLNEDVRHLVVDCPGGMATVVSLRDVMAVLLSAASPHLWLATLRVALNGRPGPWQTG